MQSSIILVTLILGTMLPFAHAEIPAAPKAVTSTGRVLIYTRNHTPDGKGYVHANIDASSAAIAELMAEKGFSSDISKNPDDFSATNLSRYKAVVFCNTNNEAFTNPAQSKALVDFVSDGGGFVGIHSATGSERQNSAFRNLLGGVFIWHTPNQPFNLVVTDKSHPATAHLPDTWRVKDEGYFCEMVDGLHVVLEMDTTSVAKPPRSEWKVKFEGNRFPLAWGKEFGKGRSFYTALGHDSTFYSDPLFRKHLLGAILWSMRVEL